MNTLRVVAQLTFHPDVSDDEMDRLIKHVADDNYVEDSVLCSWTRNNSRNPVLHFMIRLDSLDFQPAWQDAFNVTYRLISIPWNVERIAVSLQKAWQSCHFYLHQNEDDRNGDGR